MHKHLPMPVSRQSGLDIKNSYLSILSVKFVTFVSWIGLKVYETAEKEEREMPEVNNTDRVLSFRTHQVEKQASFLIFQRCNIKNIVYLV